jgi:hypothetical protein
MKSSRLIFAVITVALSGCATTSGVVPIGNGAYEITGSSATALASGGGQKMKLLKSANEFCTNQGKQMNLVSAASNSGQVGSSASVSGSAYAPASAANYHAQAIQPGKAANADVIFRCD